MLKVWNSINKTKKKYKIINLNKTSSAFNINVRNTKIINIYPFFFMFVNNYPINKHKILIFRIHQVHNYHIPSLWKYSTFSFKCFAVFSPSNNTRNYITKYYVSFISSVMSYVNDFWLAFIRIKKEK